MCFLDKPTNDIQVSPEARYPERSAPDGGLIVNSYAVGREHCFGSVEVTVSARVNEGALNNEGALGHCGVDSGLYVYEKCLYGRWSEHQ